MFGAPQYCAMCLGNLAAEPDNHEEMVKLEAIYALMILLRTEDVESGRYPVRDREGERERVCVCV